MSEKSSTSMVSDRSLEIVRRRIVAFLPGMGKVPVGTQLALAHVTLSYGLDPFMGDVWPVPQRYKGKVVGYRLMFGIAARRKVAHRSGEYDGCTFRWLTEREAELLGVDLKAGVKGIACEVCRRGIKDPFVGFGVVFPDDPSKMNHGQLAKLRAERAALKMAFPVELPSVMEAIGGLEEDIEDVDEDVIEGELVQEEDEGAIHVDEEKPRSARQNELELFGEED